MKRLLILIGILIFFSLLAQCIAVGPVSADDVIQVSVDIPEVARVNKLLTIHITDVLTPPDANSPCGGINSVIMHYPEPVDGIALGLDQIQLGTSWIPPLDYQVGSVLYIDEQYDFIPDVSGTYEFQINTLALCDIKDNPLFTGIEIRKVVIVQ